MKEIMKIKKLWLVMGIVLTSWSTCFAGSAFLEWYAPSSGGSAQGYYLYYGKTNNLSNMVKTNIDSTTTQYQLNNLDDGTQYYFYVSAYNSVGEGPVSQVLSRAIPSAPTSLRVVE